MKPRLTKRHVTLRSSLFQISEFWPTVAVTHFGKYCLMYGVKIGPYSLSRSIKALTTETFLSFFLSFPTFWLTMELVEGEGITLSDLFFPPFFVAFYTSLPPPNSLAPDSYP